MSRQRVADISDQNYSGCVQIMWIHRKQRKVTADPCSEDRISGFHLDSVSFTIALTKKKWDDIFALVSSILSHSHSKQQFTY